MKKRIITFFNRERLILITVLFVSLILHGYNMFHYPYYENDEGTYMSQAWSLLSKGSLAPYTYWYDHAPAGWIFIALWSVLSGGFFTFGASVNSGRVFMLVLHLLSTYFIYSTTKKISKSTLAAVIASLLFSISPLGIYFQRRVLLDNIMSFWILFSFWLLIRPTQKLRYIILSSISFGIAVLSKENAVFFLPGFMYMLLTTTKKSFRLFSVIYFLVLSFSLISLYVVYAYIKTELFPVGAFGNSSPHVSLLQTLHDQLSRGSNLPFYQPGSEFMQNFKDWVRQDKLFIYGGIIATIINAFLSIKVKKLRIPTLFSVLFWLFLIRGKLVIVFYIIPLLPFLAISIALLAQQSIQLFSCKKKIVYQIQTVCILLGIVLLFASSNKEYLFKDETTPQLQTIEWIKQHVPPDARIVIDDSIYVDLHEKRFSGDPVFPYAEWAWKIEKDPQIYRESFGSDWTNIEYITLSHEMLKQIGNHEFPFTKNALDNATQVADYTTIDTSYRKIPQYISTNGDWMSIYKVADKNSIFLSTAWMGYKNTYIHSYGQVIDPITKLTTSELQAEALLRAAWIGDKDVFQGVYSWTKDHLGFRGDTLFAREWGIKNGKAMVLNPDSSSYADTTIAFALLIANNRWPNNKYGNQAKLMIQNIWEKEVVSSMIVSGSSESDQEKIDLKTLNPAALRTFAIIDPSHPWSKLITNSYAIMEDLTQAYPTGVLPRIIKTSDNTTVGTETIDVSEFVIASILDQQLFKTDDSITLLTQLKARSSSSWIAHPLLMSLDSEDEVNAALARLRGKYNRKTGAFGDKNDIWMQSTAWYTSALINQMTPPLNK